MNVLQQALGPFPVSEPDALTILSDVKDFESATVNALAAIITMKPTFQNLPFSGVPAMIKANLNSLNTSAVAFEGALILALIAVVPVRFSIAWIDVDKIK